MLLLSRFTAVGWRCMTVWPAYWWRHAYIILSTCGTSWVAGCLPVKNASMFWLGYSFRNALHDLYFWPITSVWGMLLAFSFYILDPFILYYCRKNNKNLFSAYILSVFQWSLIKTIKFSKRVEKLITLMSKRRWNPLQWLAIISFVSKLRWQFYIL